MGSILARRGAEVKDAVNKAIADMKAGKIAVPATRKDAGYSG